MALYCAIETKDKKIERVKTKDGKTSILFDSMMSIPFAGTKESIVKNYAYIFSEKFTSFFGKWYNNTPKNRKAVNDIRKSIGDVIAPEVLDNVIYAANGMNNPRLVALVEKPTEYSDTKGVFYTTDLSKSTDYYLYNEVVSGNVVVDEDYVADGSTALDTELSLLSANFNPVVNFSSVNGNDYVIIKEGVEIQNISTLEESEHRNPFTYSNGEPKLFFKTPSGSIYDSYSDALKNTQTGMIAAGFIASDNVGYAESEYGLSILGNDVVVYNDSVKLNNEKSFETIMNINSDSNTNSRDGLVNSLIRSDTLSGKRKLINGQYYLVGYGEIAQTSFLNSRLSMAKLQAHLGTGFVNMKSHGGIEFTDKLPYSKAKLRGRDGSTTILEKSDIKRALLEGRYIEMANLYEDMDFTAASILFDEIDAADPNTRVTPQSISEQNNSLMMSLIGIMESFGISTMKLTDYIERYAERAGRSIDAFALADLSNKIIAISEDANIGDLTEEVSHFILEMYEDQNELASLFKAVEMTDEWAEFSGAYYNTYSEFHSGVELDNIVHKEVMGKILAKEIASRFENASVEGNILSRAMLKVYEWIRNLFISNRVNQKSDLNKVMEDIADLALSMDQNRFNDSLVVDKNFAMFSVGTVSTIDRLKKEADTIEARIRSLNILRESSIEITRQKEKLMKQLKDGQTLLSFKSFTAIVDAQLRSMEAQIRSANKKRAADPKAIVWDFAKQGNLDSLNNLLGPLIKELGGIVASTTDISREDKNNLLIEIRSISGRLNEVNSLVGNIKTNDDDGILERYAEYGGMPESEMEAIKDFRSKKSKDIGSLTSLFGSLEHNSNLLLSLFGKIISNIYYASNSVAKDMTHEFVKEVDKGNWNVNRFRRILNKTAKGFSSYLKNARDVDRFYSEMEDESLRTIKGLNTINGKENPYKDMSIEDMRALKKKDKFIGGIIGTTNGIPNAKDLSLIEKADFDRRMDQWRKENVERRYIDEYYDKLESRYEMAAKERDSFPDLNIYAGTPISQETIELFREYSRRRSEVKSRFTKNGVVDWVALNNDIEAVSELNEVSRSRKAMKSDFDVETGELKSGNEMMLAKDIQAVDAYFRREMESRGERVINNEFMQELRNAESRNDAFNFLMSNGRLGFNDNFWDALNMDSFSIRLDSIDWNNTELSPNDVDRLYELHDKVELEKKKRNSIVKQYAEFNNPSEIDFGSMSKRSLDKIKEITEGIEDLQSEMFNLSRKAGVERSVFVESEYKPNNAYNDALADSGIKDEIKFIKQHTTANGSTAIGSFEKHLKDYLQGNPNVRFSFSEMKAICDYMGWGDLYLDKRDFFSMLQKTGFSKAEADTMLVEFGKNKLLPYFKRFAPAGFSQLLSDMEDGSINVYDTVDDIVNGTSDNLLLQSLSVDLQNEWYEDSRDNDQYKNPDYDESGEYGYLQPKLSKYKNQEYYDYFGIQTVNGVDTPTRNFDDWDMINRMKELKRESLGLYGERDLGYHNLYEIPQISKGKAERAMNFAKSPKSIITNMFKDTFFSRVDAPEYGQDVEGNIPEDNSLRVTPKYYLYRLENQDDISTDLAYSYMMLAGQAALYSARMDVTADVLQIQQELMSSQFESGKSPNETNTIKMFNEWRDAHMFGVRQNKKMIADVGGYQVDFSKMIHFFDKAVRTANIGFSPIIAATAATTNAMNTAIERIVGEYIDGDSFKRSAMIQAQFSKDFFNEYGKLNKTSKLYVLGERMKIYSFAERANSAGFNRIIRSMGNIEYKMLEIFNSPFAPKIMATVLYGYRSYNGKLMNFYRFQTAVQADNKGKLSKSEINKMWKDLGSRNLFDAVKIVDGKISYDQSLIDEVGIDEINKAMSLAQSQIVSLVDKTDGTISQEHKSTATRNFYLSFMTAHRGWFVNAFQTRWKPFHINYSTNKIEEGTYWSLYHVLKRTIGQFMDEKSVTGLQKAIKDNWASMAPHEARNMRRILVDLGGFAVMGALMMVAAGIKDDDKNKDDYMTQLMALIALRTANEYVSQQEPFLTRNAIDIAQSPFVAVRQLSELAKPSNWSMSEVTDGAFEGHSKLFKMAAKQTYLKHYFGLKTTDDLREGSDYWRVMNNTTLIFGQKEKKEE